MTETDPYAGIQDLDNRTIEAMESAGYLAQFIISNFLFLIVGGGLSGYVLGLVEFHEPAVAVDLAWVGMVFVVILEFLFWLSAYTAAHHFPWFGVVYRFGEKFWRNEFKMIDHKVLGWLDPKTGAPPKADDPAALTKPAEGSLCVEEIRFKNKHLPQIVAIMKGKLETVCNFQGSSMAVSERGFVFTVRNCTAVTFVRTTAIRNAQGIPVPIGILTDYSARGIEIGLETGAFLKEGAGQIKVAAGFYDSHYAQQYYQQWQNEKGLRESAALARDSTRHSVTNEAGAVVQDIQTAGTGLVKPKNQRKIGKKTKWTIVAVAFFALIALGIFFKVI